MMYLGLRPLTSRWTLEAESVLFEISCQHFVMALRKGYNLDSLSLVCPLWTQCITTGCDTLQEE